jgi:hypothetical protein
MIALAMFLCLICGQAVADGIGHEGRIEIEGLGEDLGRDRDETTGLRYWSWKKGCLIVSDPDLIVAQGEDIISFDYGESLRGISNARRVKLKGGQYDISTPLLLSDIGFQLFINAGTLDLEHGLLRITQEKPRNRRADYIFLLGVLLLTLVLLRNARRKSGKRRP